MSVAKDLRAWLIANNPHITQVTQDFVPSQVNVKQGVIWFGRTNTNNNDTMTANGRIPDEQSFDIEIYHPSPQFVEEVADAFTVLSPYRGTFGSGFVQALFIGSQTDEYIQKVSFTDAENLFSAFIELDIRLYQPSGGS